MAWNTVLDTQYKCKECNRYRVMSPHDISRRFFVVSELDDLKDFFEKKAEEAKEKPGFNSITVTIRNRQNRELSLKMIQECKKCDRVVDRVNREMNQLK